MSSDQTTAPVRTQTQTQGLQKARYRSQQPSPPAEEPQGSGEDQLYAPSGPIRTTLSEPSAESPSDLQGSPQSPPPGRCDPEPEPAAFSGGLSIADAAGVHAPSARVMRQSPEAGRESPDGGSVDEQLLAQRMRARVHAKMAAARGSPSTRGDAERAAELAYARYVSLAAALETDAQAMPAPQQHSAGNIAARAGVEAQPAAVASPTPAVPVDDSVQTALQREVQRLQAELRAAKVGAVHVDNPRGSPSAASSTTLSLPSPPAPPAWSALEAPRTTSARERIHEREITLRLYIKSTARFYALLLLTTLLRSLSLARLHPLSHLAMALPNVRDLLLLLGDVLVMAGEVALHSTPFGWIPGSSFVREMMQEAELQREWDAVPEWPVEEVKPWTEGPLRPAFCILSLLPFSSRFFELTPLPGEGEHDEKLKQVADGPLAAALKRGAGGDAAQSKYESLAAKVSAASASSAPASASASSSSCAAGVTSSISPLPLLLELQSRLESQQRLIDLLHADRAELRSSLVRLERVVREGERERERERQRQRAEAEEESMLHEWEEVGESEEAAAAATATAKERSRSGLRQRHVARPIVRDEGGSIATAAGVGSTASPQSLPSDPAALAHENAQLRAHTAASDAELAAQQRALRGLQLDARALQERIAQLELEASQQRDVRDSGDELQAHPTAAVLVAEAGAGVTVGASDA